MNPKDKQRAQRLAAAVVAFDANISPLPGIRGAGRVDSLVGQFIDSLRRVEFAHHIRDTQRHDSQRMDPASDMFDPLRAAVLQHRRGKVDEAWWLVFLATHFGKHGADKWRLTREIYGKLGQGGLWDWATTSRSPGAFKTWLAANEGKLKGRFSNHRKFESRKAASAKGTAVVFTSYISWVAPPRTHNGMVRQLHQAVGQDPKVVFQALYRSMSSVQRFGRLGKFDFLTMLGKLGIAPIEPGSAFLPGATGPLRGVRLLFGGRIDAPLSAKTLDAKLIEFGQKTGLGMQVLEDSLCNWQKSPDVYRPFRG
jgi:hypothetical protein